ncbi:hypothetical protein HW49_03190 [Porphyromonadaceae bacterium COT-184 OH4590]|nr:hypothetical protein HW49_03190 [Porphyromonadaceae bacterium COT-184 OH4590]MDO4726748.1 LicD family protein [Porphyromonadaceae bacterium]
MRDLLVKIALKLGIYKQLVEINTAYSARKKSKSFHKYGLETLIQADKAFRLINVKMFLCFGTLLGAYREKNFIDHDCDLDVGVFANQRPDNLDEIMEKFGFRHKRQFYVKQTGIITEDQYEYKGVQIDIFYYFEKDNGDVYCYGARRHEYKEWKEANRTDGFPSVLWRCPATTFSEQEFLGHKFFMPDNIKNWLTSLYGATYMTPIKNWTDKDSKTDIIYHTERLYRRYYLK